MLTPFTRKVLEQARINGAIGDGDLEAVRILADQGVHPEQVLVGGGLVSRNQYAEWLSKASGWPAADLLPDKPSELNGLDESLMQRGVLPILVTKKAAEIAFTDTDDGLVEQVRQIALRTSKEFRPSMMLVAEFRQRIPMKERLMHPIRTLKSLFEEADRRKSHQIRLLPSQDSWHAFFDAGSDREAVSIPLRSASALRMRLTRSGVKSGWHVQASRSGSEPVLFLVRRKGSGSHPLEWSSMDGTIKEGLTIVIAPDAFAVRHFAGKIQAYNEDNHWTDGEGAMAYDADNDQGRELALHAALSGRSALAVASEDGDWYSPARTAGIPVKIVRGHRSGQGIAWETVA